MSATLTLHRLDPALVARLATRAAELQPLRLDGMVTLLKEFGTTKPEALGLGEWDELDGGSHAERLNALLLPCTSQQSWGLDKARDASGGFAEVFSRDPTLRPIVDVLDAGFSKTDPVQAFRAPGAAVIGIASTDLVRRAFDAWKPYAGADARQRIAALKGSFFAGVFGGKKYAQAWLETDYLWTHWQVLGAALRETATNGQWLGIDYG